MLHLKYFYNTFTIILSDKLLLTVINGHKSHFNDGFKLELNKNLTQ